MAGRALHREARSGMRWPGRLPVLLHMAGRAFGAEAGEDARRGRLVAALARGA